MSTAPSVGSSGAAAAHVDHSDAQVQTIVRALALALGDPELRARMFADLRDSPFPKHKLHLQTYLSGPSGMHLLIAGSGAIGSSTEAVMMILDSLPPMELSVPNELDRLRWTGTNDVVVVGTGLSGPELLRGGQANAPLGVTIAGGLVPVPLFEAAAVPLIAIRPTHTDFGVDPEARRQAAPDKSRQTISTPAEEFTVSSTSDCGPEAIVECDPETGGSTPRGDGKALPSGYTYQCFVSPSAPGNIDSDEVLDQCEYEIAYAFRPFLSLATEQDEDLRREEYWAVRRHGTYSVRIFYAFGWYFDGGSATGDFEDHVGDSEWIVMEVDYRNGRWAVVQAKLSAHWNAGWPWDSTQTYAHSEFSYPEGVTRTRPLVWVAENKHANYNGSNSCDRGAWLADNCDWNDWNTYDHFYEFHVLSSANLGRSGLHIQNCVYSRGSSISENKPSFPVDPGRQECFWTINNRFQGWLSTVWDPGTGDPYQTALSAHEF